MQSETKQDGDLDCELRMIEAHWVSVALQRGLQIEASGVDSLGSGRWHVPRPQRGCGTMDSSDAHREYSHRGRDRAGSSHGAPAANGIPI